MDEDEEEIPPSHEVEVISSAESPHPILIICSCGKSFSVEELP